MINSFRNLDNCLKHSRSWRTPELGTGRSILKSIQNYEHAALEQKFDRKPEQTSQPARRLPGYPTCKPTNTYEIGTRKQATKNSETELTGI